MKPGVRRAIFIIPFPLWLLITIAWFLGAGGVAFHTRAGAEAKIDFNRKYDHTVLALTPSVGLMLDSTINEVFSHKSGPAPFCWLCGRERPDEVLLQDASYRSGSWLYRAPANDPDLSGWAPTSAEKARKLSRVLAYDIKTGDTVVAPEGSTIDGKKAILDGRGFVADAEHKLTPQMLAEWPEESMMREGCVIVQAAFGVVLALWLMGWGAWWLIFRKRRAAMAQA